jgi:hypothetical protein
MFNPHTYSASLRKRGRSVDETPARTQVTEHLWMKLLELTYKRHKLYDMPMPEQLVKYAAEAGVDLDEAFGDKSSPPEAGIGDKEPRGLRRLRILKVHLSSPLLERLTDLSK